MIANGMRIGLGHDRHRLVAGRPLILGGLTIEFEMGLDGHSDADVLLHAVTDAILGAAGLGDIGEWFPNSDPQWANANSAIFLRKAVDEVRQRGWEIANLDCTVHAERPRLSPFKRAIASKIAELAGISDDFSVVTSRKFDNPAVIVRPVRRHDDHPVALNRLHVPLDGRELLIRSGTLL